MSVILPTILLSSVRISRGRNPTQTALTLRNVHARKISDVNQAPSKQMDREGVRMRGVEMIAVSCLDTMYKETSTSCRKD